MVQGEDGREACLCRNEVSASCRQAEATLRFADVPKATLATAREGRDSGSAGNKKTAKIATLVIRKLFLENRYS